MYETHYEIIYITTIEAVKKKKSLIHSELSEMKYNTENIHLLIKPVQEMKEWQQTVC